MSKKLPKTPFQSGQMLIGILVALAVFMILAHAIFTLTSSSFEFVSFNRARITARHLAQEKLELIRNLPYDNLGTQGGIPSGPLQQEEKIQRNKLPFTIKTSIVYIDDPFDQNVPNDLLATDYKRVRVEVNWPGVGSSRRNPVVYVTDVAPKGIETTGSGGTLSVLIFDANAQPVSGASVTISAPSASPAVNLTLQTGSNGRIILPGAPPCVACYEISITKNGYTSERTYSTSEIANPNNPHVTILQGELSEVSFAIDRVSTLNIATTNNRESGFSPLPNITVNIRGTKTLGTDSLGVPVYKFDENITTGGTGTYALNNLEWDSVNVDLVSSGYDMSGTNPFIPLTIAPNSNVDFDLSLSSNTPRSLLLSFTNSSNTPIASVSANINDGSSFEQSVFSGALGDPDFGQTFFENLGSGTYSVTATASGFLDYAATIPVAGDVQESIILTPQ